MSSLNLPSYEPDRPFTVLQSETAVNVALCGIQGGVIGFDTEFCEPEQGTGDVETEVEGEIDMWSKAKLCVVQIAIPSDVFIIPVKRIKGNHHFSSKDTGRSDVCAAFPLELKRVVQSQEVVKAGVGFPIDGKIIFDAVGVDTKNMVDVGLLTKFSNVEEYLDSDQTPLGLERCVQDVLHSKMDKTMQKQRWDGALTDAHKKYAGLDAQASLEVYNAVVRRASAAAMTIPRGIPTDWYSFDCTQGRPTRREKSYEGKDLSWSAKFCTWYQSGRFVGYNF
ncbi:hypothetical protein B0H16DRAFT_1728908 [Mycena metata]|uniref:3'-5' exonuclease domain-containing protein n=1 Tax=Mycena metata TaxID=1033252 RepID=A0AAD7IDB6_9AGAR|nr:hypothetical protein B0H16DRAFT_1728908 [Mycena metata]